MMFESLPIASLWFIGITGVLALLAVAAMSWRYRQPRITEYEVIAVYRPGEHDDYVSLHVFNGIRPMSAARRKLLLAGTEERIA